MCWLHLQLSLPCFCMLLSHSSLLLHLMITPWLTSTDTSSLINTYRLSIILSHTLYLRTLILMIALLWCTIWTKILRGYGTYSVQKLLNGYISVDTGFLVATCNKPVKKLTSWMWLTSFLHWLQGIHLMDYTLKGLLLGTLSWYIFKIFDVDDSDDDAILVPRSINGSRLNFPYWSVIVHLNNFALHIILSI